MELDLVAGHVHERLLQRCLLGGELVESDPLVAGGVADLGCGEAGDLDAAVHGGDGDVRGGEGQGQVARLR